MRGIRRTPLMPPIPLYIGIPGGSNPQNEGDRPKTRFFIFIRQMNLDKVPLYRQQSTTLSSTKHHFIVIKVHLYRQQSIPLSLMKCRLAGLEDSPNDRRGLSSRVVRVVLVRRKLYKLHQRVCDRCDRFAAKNKTFLRLPAKNIPRIVHLQSEEYQYKSILSRFYILHPNDYLTTTFRPLTI